MPKPIHRDISEIVRNLIPICNQPFEEQSFQRAFKQLGWQIDKDDYADPVFEIYADDTLWMLADLKDEYTISLNLYLFAPDLKPSAYVVCSLKELASPTSYHHTRSSKEDFISFGVVFQEKSGFSSDSRRI